MMMPLPPDRNEDRTPLPLYVDESVSDLARAGLRLIQPLNGFRFGEDTVLLADFAARLYDGQDNRRLRIADLGAGCGASTILLAARLPASTILAVEMDPHSLSALDRNLKLNELTKRVSILGSDYSRWDETPPCAPDGSALAGSFDLVLANPPYRLAMHGKPAAGQLRMSREEQAMTLANLMHAARLLLKPRGRLALVHQSARLTDVMTRMRQHRIEPKTLCLISSVAGRPPVRLLLAGVHLARPGSLSIPVPLVIRDEQHRLTDEVRRIYGNDSFLTEEALNAGLVCLDREWQAGTSQSPQTTDVYGGIS